MKSDLSKFNNSWYHPGRNGLIRALWFLINACFFRSFFPVNGIKLLLLRLFGAKIGQSVVVKPRVSIKYPWKLSIGDNSWIGEEVWIDNLAEVTIASNCCVSQGAMLLTGNHNYKKESFDLMIGEINLEEGVWVGAKSIVCPGVRMKNHSVLSVGSVLSSDTEAFGIYRGNPAIKVKERVISLA